MGPLVYSSMGFSHKTYTSCFKKPIYNFKIITSIISVPILLILYYWLNAFSIYQKGQIEQSISF